jgi:hypothetical protein
MFVIKIEKCWYSCCQHRIVVQKNLIQYAPEKRCATNETDMCNK